MFDMAIAGQNAGQKRVTGREIAISIKEASAPDAISITNPAQGWVAVSPPGSGAFDSFRIDGLVDGRAQWHFSCADLLAYRQGLSDGKQTGGKFPKRTAYHLKVTALDADQHQLLDRITDVIFFAHVTEIRQTSLSVPRHATLLVEIKDPKVIPERPVVAVQLGGRKVWVPESTATLNTTTGRPEPGAWQWTRNPVWCACDLITDGTFGAGEFFGWEHIDLETALAAASFCDETVDGETRAEVDYVVQDRSALLDHVARILAGAQVIPTLSGGTWRLLKDVDGPAVMALTDADIQQGEISSKHLSLEEIPNRVEVQFTDEDSDGELVTDMITLPDAEPDRIVSRRLDLRGVRRRSQARRLATLMLYQWANQRVSVELAAASYRLLALEPTFSRARSPPSI